MKEQIDRLMRQMSLTLEDCDHALQEAFKLACLEAVRDARSNDTYKDQSGNLRNSIGYVVYKDGVEIASNFVNTATPQEGNNDPLVGTKVGKEVAVECANGYPQGLVLVVVAGMGYAYYVERDGYDVITGATNALPASLMNKIQSAFSAILKNFGKR